MIRGSALSCGLICGVEKLLESLLASSPEMLFVADAEGQLQVCSAALPRRLGPCETVLELAAEASRDAMASFFDGLVAGGEPRERSFVATDGAQLRCRVVKAPDASLHGGLHPIVVDEQAALERDVLRALMENLDIAVWAADSTGQFVFHDGKGLRSVGMTPGQLLGLNVFTLYGGGSDEVAVRAALAGELQYTSTIHEGTHWDTLHIPQTASDGRARVVGVTTNETAVRRAEEALKLQLNTVREQERAIHDLSTPLIEVWDEVLAVPLIGVIDSRRASSLIERLLAAVGRTGARFALLDLTGVEAIDTSSASHLIRLLASIRLLGAEGMITGISAQVAQTMVGIGIDLQRVKTFANLRDALRYCMRKHKPRLKTARTRLHNT